MGDLKQVIDVKEMKQVSVGQLTSSIPNALCQQPNKDGEGNPAKKTMYPGVEVIMKHNRVNESDDPLVCPVCASAHEWRHD